MYKKYELEYSYDQLEPYIDTKTVDVHYNRHYLGYLEKLNKLLTGSNYDFKYTKEELVYHIDEFPGNLKEDILFNLGGVLNHELYFACLSPNKNNIPYGSLLEHITRTFKSYENFKDIFTSKAISLKGSGYVFLVLDKNNNLVIVTTANQVTPLSYNLKPIITIDVWEHAYYLKNLNLRGDYINNYFNVIDFNKVEDRYNNYKM